MVSFCKRNSLVSGYVIFLLTINATFVTAQNLPSGDTTRNRYTAVRQPVYTTIRIQSAKPVIDGKLNDECWKNGSWAGDYHQWIPVEGAKPTYPTEFNIQYDDKNIYVAFRGYDGEPEKINRLSGPRDEQVGDMMGVTFDSYRDYRTGFEFTMTAWGQKTDLILFNPMDWDFNWDPVWKGKTGLEDSAWILEMEIPLSQLRYSRENEQVWGLHTWRWISRLQEESNWEIQSKTGPGMLYNFGELRGISELKKSRRLEVMPFVLGSLRTMEAETDNPFTENGRLWGGNAGLDAKIGISSNFTVDLTVNPDFGQVESDPSVMNLTAFETFYEEKRPFFLEGLTIFNYDFDERSLFYSRRIGHSPSLTINPNDTLFTSTPDKTTILSAMKFSGTTSKGLSVGLIQSVTADEFTKISDRYGNRSEAKVEPLTSYTVARVQKGYKAGNTVIGGMLTSTNRIFNERDLDFLAKEAFTGGIDLLHHWKDKKFYLNAKLLGSYVGGSTEAVTALQESSARYFQRPDADYLDLDTTRTSLSGFGGKIKVGKGAKGLWKYSTGLSWLSPGLELNDLGYMNSADEIEQQNEVNYLVTKPVSVFNTLQVDFEQFNSWNFGGTWLGSGGELSFLATLKNNWTIRNSLIYHSQAYDPRKLRGGPDMLMPFKITNSGGMMTDPSKKIMFHLAYGIEVSGDNSARSYEISPSVSIRPFSKLRIRLIADYRSNLDELQYIAARNYNGEKRYILGTIDQQTLGFTLRADLNLTPEFSIQYYGSPFVSQGSYSEYKRITDPAAKEYGQRFTLFDDPVFDSGNIVGLDENNDSSPDYYVTMPDFTFFQYRSNLVAKWEYRLGSFIYLVWSADRTGSNYFPDASLGESYGDLWQVQPGNIFLIKLSYWFSL